MTKCPECNNTLTVLQEFKTETQYACNNEKCSVWIITLPNPEEKKKGDK